MSPVEQIALTVNIALRRDVATLDYYCSGSSPDAFATLPKEWTGDQIRSFQDYFDAQMSGNMARRRMLKFMPADFRLIEARQPPLKDQYDEWLARVICYAFSVPATPFVAQVNRATSETMRLQATQEGLVPLKSWIKSALDLVIQVCMNEPDLEFVWVGDDAIDPLQQAQTLNILVTAGIKTREEARAELGLGGGGKAGTPAGLGKYNHNHDERGRFSAADNAADPGGEARKPRAKGVQVASNGAVASDAGGLVQIEPMPVEPPPLEPPETPSSTESLAPASSKTLVEVVAPKGKLPGTYAPGTDVRTMPASDDPDAAALDYGKQLYDEKTATPVETGLEARWGFAVEVPSGAHITCRPAGLGGRATLPTTATVEINDARVNELNGGEPLKLKFPKK